MTYWYKTSNTLIDDTKLRLISAKLAIPHCETVATFHSLLERCSKNDSEYFATDFDEACDEIDLQLGINNASSILQEFQARKLIDVIKLLKWNDYQANTSTQRVKEWREKKKSETLRNVTETNVTQNRIEKIRIEKKEKEIDKEKMKATFPLVDIDLEFEKFNDYIASNGKRYKDKPAGFRNWCRNAEQWSKKNGTKQNNGQYHKPSQSEQIESAIARLGERYGIDPSQV